MSAYTDDPQTRVEAILQNILGKNNLLQPPQTRVEELLLLIYEQGGGGGTEPVIKYKGVTTTPLTDGSTTNPIEIDGEEVTVATGDFVAYNGAEFIWNGTTWQELGDLELVAAIMTSIAPTYSESETYDIGDKVYYNDILYRCLDNNVTGSFVPAKWEQISVAQILSELESDVDSIFGTISDTYDPSTTYNEGNLVIHNKKLYKCNTDGTTGTWNSAKWDETTIAYELENATPVEANPAEDATAELNKLKIFDDVYSVGNAHFMPISQDDYDALTDEEIHNGTIYFIYDAPALEVTANPEDDPEEPLVKLSIDGVIYYVPAELPEVTPEDSGKILKVVDGAWVAAEEVDPTSIIDDNDTDTDTVWSSSKTDSEIIRTLSGLTDTEITSPTDKQILRYDNTSSKWVNSDETSVTKTATGNPIEITDAAAAPMVKCVTEIQGSQDLHGYDKPWVGGAGKNKLEITGTGKTESGVTIDVYSDRIVVNGTATADVSCAVNISLLGVLTENESYILSGCPEGGGTGTGKYNMYIFSSPGYATDARDIGNGATFTVNTTGATALNVYVYIKGGAVCNNLTFYPMIRLSSVADSTFAPYSNICPITAYTEGEIEVRGKNIIVLSSDYVVETQNNSVSYGDETTFQASGTYSFSKVTWSGLTVGEVYTVSLTGKSTGDYNKIYLCKRTYTEQSDIYYTLTLTGNYDNYSFSFVSATTDFSMMFYVTATGTTGTMNIKNLMLEKGSTPTTYEPYTSTTHTTTFPSAIYRGSEDVVNGTETHDKVKIVFDGSVDESWNYESSAQGDNFYINIADAIEGQYASTGLISNMFEASTANALQKDKIHISFFKNLNCPMGDTLDIHTVADWKTWLTTHNLEVVYNVTESTASITVSNLPIRTLSGYNHIESSTGEMTIDYITNAYQPIVDLITSSAQVYREVTAQEYEDLPDSKNTDGIMYFVN